ncbi:MAG TPA: DUF2877 domain-containing protein, partial [Blastococcus sp.]|nr:DUF2877 domain-containing protein [Blastococcus sp.]
MRAIDDTTVRTGTSDGSALRGRAARAGVPTIPIPRQSARDTARTAQPARVATAVPAAASTGVADLLRGPA